MKILNLSLDSSILDKNSNLSRRVIEYGSFVDYYAIVVPDKDHREIRLSEKVFVYGSGGGNKIFQLLNVYRVAKKLLKQEKFDVITVQDQYYLALIGWFLARKFKIGLELQIHGFEKYSGLRKIIAKFMIPRANAIRCVSQRLKRQLINEFGAQEEKITVAPIFSNLKSKISCPQRQSAAMAGAANLESAKIKSDKFVFLTVGRLVPVKNIGLQIKAMAEVVKNYPKTELWIVGDGTKKSNLKSQISKIKLENNVKLLGWQNNPDEFYFQADAFLLTSNYEGWGMAVVEAASYGLPIIMTDVGCAGEFIKDGESGMVIPVNDQVKLEEVMIKLIEDDNLRKKIMDGTLSAVKKLPNKEETMALYKKSWEKAINNQ